jgi:hypothetical protein
VAIASCNAHRAIKSRNYRLSFWHPKIPSPGVVLQVATDFVTLRNRIGAPTREWNCYIRWVYRGDGWHVTRRKLHGSAEDEWD